jgi:hypothetical protein
MTKPALFTLAFLVASATAGAAVAPLVPPVVQAAIKAKAGTLAYVPTRAPIGWRYLSYSYGGTPRVLTVRMQDKHYATTNTNRTALFTASYFPGTATCSSGKQKTIQYDGNKVYWTPGLAWRCVAGDGGKVVKLAASNPILPDVALAQIVSSGKRLK